MIRRTVTRVAVAATVAPLLALGGASGAHADVSVPAAAAAYNSGHLAASSFPLRNGAGGKLCLDAENDSYDNPYNNGDHVQLWQCSGASNQQWIPYSISGGLENDYIFKNAMSGLCLDAETDAYDNPNNDGDPVQLWTCNKSLQQDWQVYDNGADRTTTLVNGFTNQLVLDAENDSYDNPSNNGDHVQLWHERYTANQEWY
jgi:hypothetical protein